MKNFNLLVSTSRFNEINAKAELWFMLLMCGDKYSIISNLEFSGLITALTVIKNNSIISMIKKILQEDPDFFQYILKIVPIDYNCATSVQIISEIVKTHYREYISKKEKYMIKLNRRNHDEIKRDELISSVAKGIENEVNLEHPDKIVRIEILGNFCGISFLKPGDIIKIRNKVRII